jgi:prophage regulatory protein
MEVKVNNQSQRILRIKEVIVFIGLSRSTIYDMVERGDFPKPIKLGARAIGWREFAVDEWITNRKSVDQLAHKS